MYLFIRDSSSQTPKGAWALFSLHTHAVFTDQAHSNAYIPAINTCIFSQEFTPLSKEKKHQNKNPNRSGREEAVTPAAVESNKNLEFTIKRLRR